MPEKRTVPDVADQLSHLLGGAIASGNGRVEFEYSPADLELREQCLDAIEREEARHHARILPFVQQLMEIQVKRGRPVLVVSTKPEGGDRGKS